MAGLQSLLKNNQIDKKKVILVENSDIRMIQHVLLEMLDDVLYVCKKYNIQYQLSGGSTLGAIRHHGFIPWDDDMDINMPRTEADRFLRQFKRIYKDKYWIHVPGETPNYDYMMIRIMNKNVRARVLLDPDKKECGICVDIFIVENTFDNWLLRRIHGFGCMFFRYALSCIRFQRNADEIKTLFQDDKTLSRYYRIRSSIGKILMIIPLNWWTKISSKWVQICKDNTSKYVVIIGGSKQFFQELYTRKNFNKNCIKKFENRDVNVTSDYDQYLTKLYGNYMEIPSNEKKEKHIMLELDKKALMEMYNTDV